MPNLHTELKTLTWGGGYLAPRCQSQDGWTAREQNLSNCIPSSPLSYKAVVGLGCNSAGECLPDVHKVLESIPRNHNQTDTAKVIPSLTFLAVLLSWQEENHSDSRTGQWTRSCLSNCKEELQAPCHSSRPGISTVPDHHFPKGLRWGSGLWAALHTFTAMAEHRLICPWWLTSTTILIGSRIN